MILAPVDSRANVGLQIGDAVASGTPGSVLFVDSSGNLGQDNANFFWDDSDNQLVIRATEGNFLIAGAVSITPPLVIDTSLNQYGFSMQQFSTDTNGSVCFGKKSRGTISSPAPIESGDYMIALYGLGYRNSSIGYSIGGGISLIAEGNPGDTTIPSYWQFAVGIPGGLIIKPMVEIHSDYTLRVGAKLELCIDDDVSDRTGVSLESNTAGMLTFTDMSGQDNDLTFDLGSNAAQINLTSTNVTGINFGSIWMIANTITSTGSMTIFAPAGTGGNQGSSIEVDAGSATGGNGAGGDFIFNAGNGFGSGDGGTFTMTGGAPGDTGNGGPMLFQTSTGGATSGSSGNLSLLIGDTTDGNSGTLTIQGLGANGTNKSGANFLFDTGASTGNKGTHIDFYTAIAGGSGSTQRTSALRASINTAGQFQVGLATGIGMTAASGVLTIAGIGNTNNENITVDLESTANTCRISSTSGTASYQFYSSTSSIAITAKTVAASQSAYLILDRTDGNGIACEVFAQGGSNVWLVGTCLTSTADYIIESVSGGDVFRATSTKQVTLPTTVRIGKSDASSTDGAQFVAGDGTLTIGGFGNTNNESLAFDFESVANQILLTSSTGAVPVFNFSSISFTNSTETLSIIPNSPSNYVRITTNPTSHLELESGGDIDIDMFSGASTMRFQQGGTDVATLSGGGAFNIIGSIQCDSIVNDTGLSAGTYTPTRSAEVNMDANVTMTEAQYSRVGNTITVSGRFTADPTLTATTTSFEITLPVASNIGAAEDVAGVAFCGNIVSMGAEIIGVAANDTAKIQWKSSDVTSQTWSYQFSYQVI